MPRGEICQNLTLGEGKCAEKVTANYAIKPKKQARENRPITKKSRLITSKKAADYAITPKKSANLRQKIC